MAGITEIRTRIDSVQQTLKITNAMYLISSSKLRKARQQLAHVQPFYERIRETIADILHRSDEMQHVYFDKREKVAEHKVGYIVISGDKGLAGAYNHNILHLTEEQMAQHPNSMLFVVGQMGRSYFSGKNVNLDRDFLFAAQDPTLSRADDICEVCIQNFRDGTLDEIYVIYTEMVTPLPGAGAESLSPRLCTGHLVRYAGRILLRRAKCPHDGNGLLQHKRQRDVKRLIPSL